MDSFSPEVLQVVFPLLFGSNNVSGIELAKQPCILQKKKILAFD